MAIPKPVRFVRYTLILLLIASQRLLGERLLLRLVASLWKPGYLFVVYPGSDQDVMHIMPRWLARSPWVRSNPALIGLITPGKKTRSGLVFAISNTTKQLLSRDAEEDLVQIKQRLESISQHLGVDTIALAGQLPGIMARRGHLPKACVSGTLGTIYSIGTTLTKLVPKEKLADLSLAIIGVGRIGKSLQETLKPHLSAVHGVDSQSQPGVHVPGDPEYKDVLQQADVLVLLTPRGRDAIPHINQANPRALIIDDTHPRLLNAELSPAHLESTYKVALSSGAKFRPRLPGYQNGWLPGCALEAQVLSTTQRQATTYADFCRDANALEIRPMTIRVHEDATAK